jgi:hypothetical protein
MQLISKCVHKRVNEDFLCPEGLAYSAVDTASREVALRSIFCPLWRISCELFGLKPPFCSQPTWGVIFFGGSL